MKTITTNIMSAALIAPLLYGCSSDIGDNRDKTIAHIAFTATDVIPVTATRGTQITKDDISSFGVSCAIYPATTSYTSAGCGSYFYNMEVDAATGTTDRYWPGSEYKVSFFAYAPYNNPLLTIRSKKDIGYPVYAYTVPSDITRQVDFITADVIEHSGTGTTEPVALTFSHRLTDIRITCENTGAEHATLKSISLCGLEYSGTFSGNTWTLTGNKNSSTENPFTLTVERTLAPESTIDVTGTENHFLMLPQKVPAGTQLFDIHATVAGETRRFYYILDKDLTLEAGKVYTFKLKLSDILEVDEETDIQDWKEQTDRTGIPTQTGTDAETHIFPWTEE